jgi:hypothetical protein
LYSGASASATKTACSNAVKLTGRAFQVVTGASRSISKAPTRMLEAGPWTSASHAAAFAAVENRTTTASVISAMPANADDGTAAASEPTSTTNNPGRWRSRVWMSVIV